MAQKEMRIDKPYLNLPVRPDAPIAWVNWERPDGGLLYGGGFKFFGVQILGVVTVAAYAAVIIFIVFTVIKKTIGLRCSAEDEIEGLDISEHGLASAYADWVPATSMTIDDTYEAVPITGTTPVEKAVPVVKESKPEHADGGKYTKITIVCNQSKFEPDRCNRHDGNTGDGLRCAEG